MKFPHAPRVCAGLPAVLLLISLHAGVLAQSQGAVKVSFKVALVDKDLNVKPVPKFTLGVQKLDASAPADATPAASIQLVTSFDGTTSASLLPGDYVVKSEKAIIFEGKAYEWEVKLKVEDGKEAAVELSTDNANVKQASGRERKRAFAEEAELFRELRDGVVTIEGELGHGTGFVVDQRGLILTNQHVVSQSKEIRVQFDSKHKVQAVVLAEDPEKDVAVLWANLAACQSCKVLKLADQSVEPELGIIEGERIFAIGSPLSQDKILTTGVVSKVEKRAILSDVNINPGNSGGPL
ncbi:MAG TPA: trypsin-like peptidase domain-containing protein, partial [Pyrinomonadaceae bacterium]|nr:trypsin-like peptidase domain-containing protein [Pyrinomonadaceae bacterium]